MKIAAKPMGLPHTSEVTEKLLHSTPAGKKVIKLIEDARDQGLLSCSVNDYLKKGFRKTMKEGTCAGQAVTVMIAQAAHPRQNEKTIMKSAKMADAIAFQIISDIECDYRRFSRIGLQILTPAEKNKKKVMAKAASNREAKKIGKKLDKKINKDIDKTEAMMKIMQAAALHGLHLPRTIKESEKMGAFAKKAENLTRALIEEQSPLQYVKSETFQKTEKLTKRLTELLDKDDKQIVLRVLIRGKKGAHAVAFFLEPQHKVYDANEGFASFKNKKGLIKTAADLVDKKGWYRKFLAPQQTTIDIFRQRA